MRRTTKWLIAVPLVLVVLAFGGTWVYVNLVQGDAPGRLGLGSGTATTAPPTSPPTSPAGGPFTVDCTWNIAGDSVAGYRVEEVLFGQNTTAVGRTNKVTGSLTVAGSSVTATTFTVDMASVQSDKERRDGQFRTRIMDVATYPTSTFTLTKPIELGNVPAEGAEITAEATGDLTLRGRTKSVTFDVKAVRTGAQVKVNGSIPIVFAEWGIPSPSFGPAEVGDEGELEFLLVFTK